MKFFLPYATDNEVAERQYSHFKEAFGKNHKGPRVQKIRFVKEGKEYTAQVGELMPLAGGMVLAIFGNFNPQKSEAFYRVVRLVSSGKETVEYDQSMIGSPIEEVIEFDE